MSSLNRVRGRAALASALAALAWAAPAAGQEAPRQITLAEVLDLARTGSPTVGIASAQLEAARGRQRQAGAGINPELSYSVENFSGSGSLRGMDNAEATIGLSQQIELGGKREARGETAGKQADAIAIRGQIAGANLELAARERFADLSAAEERLDLARAAVARATRLSGLAQSLVDAGREPPLRLLRAQALAADLKKNGVRVLVDDDDTKGPGFKYAEYELRGACLRVDIGPKDLEQNQAMLTRRDTRTKDAIGLDAVVARVGELLEEMQKALFTKAKDFKNANTFEVNSAEELKAKADDGFLLAHWDGTPETEKRIKEEFGLTTRNRPFDLKQEPGKCVLTGNPSPGRIVFSRAY